MAPQGKHFGNENPPRISPGGPIYAAQRCCPRVIATTGTSAVVSAEASTISV